MATKPSAPNRCDVVEEPPEEKQKGASLESEPTRLSTFFPNMTLDEHISRAARYAQNPRKYLDKALGAGTMEARKHLLCIPEEVTRDIYGQGTHKSHFEQHIATLLGKKHGLFFITGIQAQLVAMKIHCEAANNNRVAWHVTSHVETAELRSYKHLYGLQRRLVGGKPDENPTVAEIEEVLSLPPHERPAVLMLEIPNRTVGCATYTFEQLEQISAACRAAGVKLHMDGARLWEIEPWYQATAGKTFAGICALFDTVYVSMYKALAGAAGAVLVTDDEDLILEARVWQRRAGGGAITLYYQIIDCERGFNENIGTFAGRRQKMLDIAAGVKAETAKFKTKTGEPFVRFTPSTPTCCQTRTVYSGFTIDELLAARDRVQEKLNVRIFERTWPRKSPDEVLFPATYNKGNEKEDEGEEGKEVAKVLLPDEDDLGPHEVEWFVNGNNQHIETSLFVRAYVALCEELLSPPSPCI